MNCKVFVFMELVSLVNCAAEGVEDRKGRLQRTDSWGRSVPEENSSSNPYTDERSRRFHLSIVTVILLAFIIS